MKRTLMALLGLSVPTAMLATGCFEDDNPSLCGDAATWESSSGIDLSGYGVDDGTYICVTDYGDGACYKVEVDGVDGYFWATDDGTTAAALACEELYGGDEDDGSDDTASPSDDSGVFDTGEFSDTADTGDGSDDTASPSDDTATPEPVDNDGDGSDDTEDCDDNDASAYPGATETCDDVDNDCDGTVDEDDATDASTWYADADGDGSGDPADSTTACDQPSGYVDNADDCDDTDATLDESCESTDSDGDGYYAGIDDCNDEDATVNPDYDYHNYCGTPVSNSGTWYLYAWDDYNYDFSTWINQSDSHVASAEDTDEACGCYHAPTGAVVEFNADNGSSNDSDDMVYSCSSQGSAVYFDGTNTCSDVSFTWDGVEVTEFDYEDGHNMTITVP